MHERLQRRVLWTALIVAIVGAAVLVPVLTNPELRLDIARTLRLVPHNEGEHIADGDSGTSLLVLPIATTNDVTDRIDYRHLAAYVAWPEGDGLRLEAVNDDGEVSVPFAEFDLLSTSDDGREMYIAGADGGAVIDVASSEVVESVEPSAEPSVAWDWRRPVWSLSTGICDTWSMEPGWIACFERPTLASYAAGDWNLSLIRWGDPDERYDVVRGLGFRPTVGFTEDDTWIYVANERGIWRYDMDEIIGG